MREVAAQPEIAFEPLGETMLLIRFGTRAEMRINADVHAAAAVLRAAELPGVVDIVPAFAALALAYSPATWSNAEGAPWQNLAAAVRAVFTAPPACVTKPAGEIEVPVCYGDKNGPDLEFVAQYCGLTQAEVVARHSAADYRVAMLGFAPGFPYLLGLDPRLNAPRRANPRICVPRGSVAIGGAQTGIYPSELPGGWQLLGRTPLRLFDPHSDPACLLAPGDHVRFRAIDPAEFDALAR